MLDSTVESVNSALKRARASLQRQRPPRRPRTAARRRLTAEDAIVARFVSAYEAADLDALVALLTDDVFMSMPPMPLEYEGRDAGGPLLRQPFRRRPQVRPRADAGQRPAGVRRLPARPDGIRHGTGLIVLTLTGDRICAMTRFETSVFPWFGLPRSLPSR